MNFLRNLPIKRKLTLIMLLTSSVALVLACFTLAAYEQLNIRNRLVRDLATTAEMTAANSTAGLTFNDPAAVEQTLKSLAAQPRIVRACVYGKAGQPFALYQRAATPQNFPAPPVRADGHHFGGNSLELFRTIDLAGESVGTIFLESDLQEVRASLWRYAFVVVALLIAGSLVALLVAARLQRIISRPIADLAGVAARVATEKNYSIRALKESDDELGRLMDGFNQMLAQIQERDAALQESQWELERRVKERTTQLADSLSLTRATLESTADGILVADGQGNVTGFNENFLAIWKIPRHLGTLGNEAAMLEIAMAQLVQPEQFRAKVQELYADLKTESFDVLEFKDGRMFERFSKPQRLGDKCVGRVWSFRDVTARKQSEAALAQLNRELLETSRQAGMAEVATGVLHNVGNVLNSVNVASSCMADNLRKSKAANLFKVVALLRTNEADLGGFFTHDPKGKQLLGYLEQLTQHIAHEQAEAQQELAELQKHIDHIKDVVTMQQSFAKVSGLTETVNAADLVEDALKMNGSALARHDVKIVKEFAETPPVTVDKHKVLQILVNLVTNAKQACGAVTRDDKRITLRIMSAADRLHIVVADNGVGVPPENLTRIFNHGFTTKKTGHGFGLHSGALAAKEMGGALKVQSDGIGCGTVFTLELPLKPTKSPHG